MDIKTTICGRIFNLVGTKQTIKSGIGAKLIQVLYSSYFEGVR